MSFADPIAFLKCNYDLAVVDEVQYLNSARLNHLWDMWETTDRQALFLAVGDFQQLEPPGGSHMNMLTSFTKFELKMSHRTTDNRVLKVLSYIRHWRPRPEHFNELCFNPQLLTGCGERDWENVEQHVAVLAQPVLDHPDTWILAVQTNVVQN